MYKIGLTGGIGSGKSTILNYLSEYPDITVIKIDALAGELWQKDTKSYHDVIRAFHEHDILMEDGVVDRRMLGAIAFSDDNLLIEMNAIAFPFLFSRL
jgi:dephospho-CoA kinase